MFGEETQPGFLTILDRSVAAILISAQSFAGRVLKEAGADVNAQIMAAYRLAFSREPDAGERKLAMDFLRQQSALIKARIEAKQPVALPSNCPVEIDQAQAAALLVSCKPRPVTEALSKA